MRYASVKVRIYPNNAQKLIIDSHINGSRFIYNYSLALKQKAYKLFGNKISTSAFSIIKHITKIKKKPKYSWLDELNVSAWRDSVFNMETAYKNFFKNKKGYPKFKSRHRSALNYTYAVGAKVKEGKLYLPKVGLVKMRGFRDDIVGVSKSATVSCKADKYFVSILYDRGVQEIVPNHNSKAVGLDMGVKLFIADSNGVKIKPIDLSKAISKLTVLQQKMSRKKLGSNNRAKAKKKVAKQHIKIANKRLNFIHNISKRYSENQTVVVEDLKIKDMTQKEDKKAIKPRAVKRKLNNSILQAGWGMFFDILKYKLEARGGRLIKVNPAYTSQTCNKCGYIAKSNRKTQAKFVCTSCGYSENADINASMNILARANHDHNASHQLT